MTMYTAAVLAGCLIVSIREKLEVTYIMMAVRGTVVEHKG